MSGYQLAQINIGRLKAPIDSPEIADFVANLDRINALAESAKGFVWRLQDEAGNATAIESPFGDGMIVNMSVWADVPSLADFVYRTAHAEILKRRREWFERMDEAYTVLWWVPGGHRPTLDEAALRLASLREHGPDAYAFTFQKPAPAPDATVAAPVREDDACPAT
jgi:hypothetical protein